MNDIIGEACSPGVISNEGEGIGVLLKGVPVDDSLIRPDDSFHIQALQL
jgi:hypothetical protein